MENIYQVDERYFDFPEGQVRELKAEKNQGILASVFRALTGSRCRTRRRQVTGILLTLVTSESTPVSNPEAETATTPLAPSKTEQNESAPEWLVPVPIVEVPTLPSDDNQLGGSYITEMQIMQVQNDSCHTSVSSLDSEVHKYLKNHFNECLNDKVYTGGSCLSQIFWEHENLSGLSIIWLIQLL